MFRKCWEPPRLFLMLCAQAKREETVEGNGGEGREGDDPGSLWSLSRSLGRRGARARGALTALRERDRERESEREGPRPHPSAPFLLAQKHRHMGGGTAEAERPPQLTRCETTFTTKFVLSVILKYLSLLSLTAWNCLGIVIV